MNSGMPYFSVPTYMTNTYEFLFPTKMYKYAVVSKVDLLNPEEKHFIQLDTDIKQKDKKNARGDTNVPRSLENYEVTNENWFDTIEKISINETLDFLSSDVFMKLTNNKMSISKSVYSREKTTPIKDCFEIVPSDVQSAKTLATFYLNLKVLLKDLKFKISNINSEKQFSKGLKSFYLLIISKLREINLPYHYLYTQIIDMGIENRQTCHLNDLKLNEYGCYLTETFYNMVDILLVLLDTDKLFFEKFNLHLNCITELTNFGNSQKKGIVEDLLSLSVFLKEKGEPFRVLLLKLAKLHLSADGYVDSATDSKLFDKIGTFAIDTIASKKLNNEFSTNYSTLLSLQILTDLVEYHSYSLTDRMKNLDLAEGISETGLERINAFNSLGWLIRFIHHRDSRIRFSTWNLLKSLVSTSLLKQHPTLVDESLE